VKVVERGIMEMQNRIAQLYTQYYRELVGWASDMAQDRYLAEDLVQNAFLSAMSHAQSLTGLTQEQLRAWLYRTVRNAYIDHWRKRRREALTDQLPECAVQKTVDEAMMVGELLMRLPEVDAHMVVLRYLEGYSAKDIGERMNCSPGAVRTRLSRAIAKLKRDLEEDHVET